MGFPHNGHPDQVRFLLLPGLLRELRHAPVQQIPSSVSVHGGYLKGIAQTQGVKLVHVRVDCAGGVALVDGQGNGLARPLQNGRHSGVGGRQAHLDVGYHNDSVGQLDADLRLAAHKLEDLVVRPRLDAAGVHEVKRCGRATRRSRRSGPG